MYGQDTGQGVITIEPVHNGVLLDTGGRRMVYELRPGQRTKAVHDLLAAVATELATGIEVRIEVRDMRGEEEPVTHQPDKRSLTQVEVESLYSIPIKTLETWRMQGKGPAYTKPGKRIYYFREDIETFLRSCQIVTTGQG
ncbi:helix-turn-helix domain-containing protein [Desulfovibrio inopinatus]|uniref:helix-turn-helix domain-containing protein n=1 Tax=Desulfovibrio inopinatus TaxID=102109 RepID=UPI00040CC28C